jgi:hypothetical protein
MKKIYLALAWLCLLGTACKKNDITTPISGIAGSPTVNSTYLIDNDFDANNWEGYAKNQYTFSSAGITAPNLNQYLYMERTIWNKKLGRHTLDKWTIDATIGGSDENPAILPGVGFRGFEQSINSPYELVYVYIRGKDVQFPNTLQLRFVDYTHKITYNQFSESLGDFGKDDKVDLSMAFDNGNLTITAKVQGKPTTVTMTYNGGLLPKAMDGGFEINAGNEPSLISKYQVSGNYTPPTGNIFINNDFNSSSWTGDVKNRWTFNGNSITTPDVRDLIYMPRTLYNAQFGRNTINKWTIKSVIEVTTDSVLILPGIGFKGFEQSDKSPYELVYVYLRGKDVQFPNTLQLRFVDYTHKITYNQFSDALGSFGKGDQIEMTLSFNEGKMTASAKVLTKSLAPVSMVYDGTLLPKWMDGGFVLVGGNHPAKVNSYVVTGD